MRLQPGLFLLFPLAAFASCSADPPFRDETDGVITITASGIDFEAFESYATNIALEELCVQSKSKSSDPSSLSPNEPECAEIDHGFDLNVLSQIHKNVDGMGLDQVGPADVDEADLYLVAGIVASDFWDLGEAFCIDDGVVEGCIKPLTKHHVYSPVGSLVMVLIDLNASKDETLEPIWAASVDRRWAAGSSLGVGAGDGGAGGEGGSSGSGTDLSLWLSGVDQAFSQSAALSGGQN